MVPTPKRNALPTPATGAAPGSDPAEEPSGSALARTLLATGASVVDAIRELETSGQPWWEACRCVAAATPDRLDLVLPFVAIFARIAVPGAEATRFRHLLQEAGLHPLSILTCLEGATWRAEAAALLGQEAFLAHFPDLRGTGDLNLQFASAPLGRKLADLTGLTLVGDLNLATQRTLEALPDRLTVRGDLVLTDSGLTSLPKNLDVRGRLFLIGAPWDGVLPADTKARFIVTQGFPRGLTPEAWRAQAAAPAN
jgi:hypothetical protein